MKKVFLSKMILVVFLILVPLYAHSAQSNEELCYAAFTGDTARVKALIGSGIDINAKDKKGLSALMIAAFKGHAASVKALIASGADVNEKNKMGMTALMFAKDEGNDDIIELLKKSGATR